MRAIPTIMLKPGTIIFRDIYNRQGQLLLPKGNVLTDKNINSLLNKGIEEVFTMENASEVTPLEEAYRVAIRSFTEVFAEALLEKTPDQKAAEEASRLLVSMAGMQSVMSQMRALFVRGNYLFRHSVNVAFLSVTLGKWLKLSEDELTELGIAALLHDIGMAGIPDGIFDHPGALSEEARLLLNQHPQKGVELLAGFSSVVQEAVLQHHERFDSSGYPNGIDGAAISTFARIIAIADIYDSLTSERVYRAKKTPYETISIIRSLSFNQLDPQAGVRFCTLLIDSFVGDRVLLDNGRVGEVIWVNTSNPNHLLVKTRSGEIVNTDDAHSPKVKEVLTSLQSDLYE